MRFKALPITDLTDVTLDFEQLQARAILDQTPQSFPQLAVAATRKIAFGQTTLTWTASNFSNSVTVTHGLGTTPLLVVATAMNAPAAGNVAALNTGAYTSTTFVVNGDTRLSGSFTNVVSWIAIG